MAAKETETLVLARVIDTWTWLTENVESWGSKNEGTELEACLIGLNSLDS
jgi:hypothetical protein